MDLLQAKEKAALKSEKQVNLADPFASDIFAGSATKENTEPEIAPQLETKKTWVWRLPKLSRPAIDWNALHRNLPTDFSGELLRLLAASLAKYLNFSSPEPVEIFWLSQRETNEMQEAERVESSWWLRVGIETSDAEFAVEIGNDTAVWLIDATLGEIVDGQIQTREITASETAVLEFLAVNLTREANKIINAPLFKLYALERKTPDWLTRKIGVNRITENSTLISNWQIVHGFSQNIVNLYLNPETLKALQASENKLLTAAPRRAALWQSFGSRVKDVRARLFLGEVRVTLADVAGLETGDVVLPENHRFSMASDAFVGSAQVFLGDGETVRLVGIFEPTDAKTADANRLSNEDAGILARRIESSDVLRLFIERVEELETPHFLEKSMPNKEIDLKEMENVESFDAQPNDGVHLENLAVTLRVELEARRLSLAEVGNLRVNQIIELGARATDPVNLLIDDKTIARGELVEVENQLGVRIIQILR